MENPLVVFLPSGRRGRFAAGTLLRDAALELGVDLDSVCGGLGRCGRCQIELSECQFGKLGIVSDASHVSGMDETEHLCKKKRGMQDGMRLGCQARVLGDAVINIQPEFQVHKSVIRKEAIHRDIELDPDIRACFVQVDPPGMNETESDVERLCNALNESWGLEGLDVEPHVLAKLPAAVAAKKGRVTALLREDRDIIDVRPGFQPDIHGVAIDIGSTTLALQLVDMASGEIIATANGMNPQIRFGEDVMSRLSFLMSNPESRGQLTACVRDAVSGLIEQVSTNAGISADSISSVIVVGNPVMHHLFLGLDASGLATAPFTLVAGGPLKFRAMDFNLGILPSAIIHALPCIGAHVGADAAAAILSEEPERVEGCALLMDVGTNAEIIACHAGRVLTASSPTGPAFEGAQISSGQRAAAGAIERVRIDPETAEPRFKVIGCDLWSDSPDFAEAAAGVGVTGICGSGIVEVLVEMARSGILLADGTIDGSAMARTSRVIPDGPALAHSHHGGETREIRVTQQDVRAIQLAKAALRAGAELLLDRLDRPEVSEIRLAGGFGSQIDPAYAVALGMLPDCSAERVFGVGNAAGSGARIALINQKSRNRLNALLLKIENIEIATEPAFQSHFVAAMSFPHARQAAARRRGGRRRM